MTVRSKALRISLNPFQLYCLIEDEFESSFLLESTEGSDRLARFSFIGFLPSKVISAKGNLIKLDGKEINAAKPIEVLQKNIPKIESERSGFIGGAVGYFSYDYVKNIEAIGNSQKAAGFFSKTEFPDFEFGIFNDGLIYDHKKKTVEYIYNEEDRSQKILDLIAGAGENGKPQYQAFRIKNKKTNMDKKTFEKVVAKAKEKIIDGEIFQVVLSRRHEFEFEGSLLKFYNYLKQKNPSPYMYYLSFGEQKIIGSSPENLVRVEGDRIESYATLAGTMPRGKNKKEDDEFEKKLLGSEKERAEHLMLVDLTRNDVGKVAMPGTVNVDEFMKVEKYSHVQHISSKISAKLAEGKTSFDAFEALFPAGTLSGAPKIRAMGIIDQLETTDRGPYGGAIGYFSFNGNCDFAITIRTLFASGNRAYVQAGAGIVYDSVPESEYLETENKMQALINALE
ncbi:anthranilate synthase component I [Candidatus Micrarchaeota archaeon]|nr:anthranilate synthase component I [Candidatus Micrarchaeota archaeon]